MNFRRMWTVGRVAVMGLAIAQIAGAVEVAKVNGKPISDKDLRSALTMSGMNEGQSASIMKDAASRRQVLNSLIDQEVLVDEAVKEKLDQDAEYKEALEGFRKQFLSSRVLQKNLGNKITEAAMKKYYEGHKGRYSTDQVHAMHILVSDEEKAKDLMKQAKAPNVDFQELAEKHSKDPSAKNNRGDLGFFGRDRMVPEFTEAAFSGDEGQVVGPVKTSYGYHVIKVLERKSGKPLSFEDVQYRVRGDLLQDIRREYVGKLRQQAKINVNDSVIDKM